MKKVHVLSPGFTNPNSSAFLMPLIRFRRVLKEAGFDIRIFDHYTDGITDCDSLLIESKMHKHDWTDRFDETLEQLEKIHQKTKVIWCDQGDSTGTFLGQVLTVVHGYLKAQLLKDRSAYLNAHYASRIWGQYYHDTYGITDEGDYIRQPAKNEADLEKLGLSWNSGLMHYGLTGPYRQRLRERLPLNTLLSFAKPFGKPDDERPLDISCRMGIPYPRATMRYQREQIKEKLTEHIPTDKLSRRAYLNELARSKVCVSPFGLGEITLKDFEVFLSGSLLLKPDMSHMETWPNFYEDGVTCISHDWDLETLEETIEKYIKNDTDRIEISNAGQERYLEHTNGPKAGELFSSHFQNVLLRFA